MVTVRTRTPTCHRGRVSVEEQQGGRTVWAPSWRVVGWTAVAGLALALRAVLAGRHDPVGGLLTGAAAVAVLSVAGYDALCRPSLVADAAGLTVRQGWRERGYPWSAVHRVQVTVSRRLLVLWSLEIDAGDDLLLLSARRLGTRHAELRAVADQLARFGAPVVR